MGADAAQPTNNGNNSTTLNLANLTNGHDNYTGDQHSNQQGGNFITIRGSTGAPVTSITTTTYHNSESQPSTTPRVIKTARTARQKAAIILASLALLAGLAAVAFFFFPVGVPFLAAYLAGAAVITLAIAILMPKGTAGRY